MRGKMGFLNSKSLSQKEKPQRLPLAERDGKDLDNGILEKGRKKRLLTTGHSDKITSRSRYPNRPEKPQGPGREGGGGVESGMYTKGGKARGTPSQLSQTKGSETCLVFFQRGRGGQKKSLWRPGCKSFKGRGDKKKSWDKRGDGDRGRKKKKLSVGNEPRSYRGENERLGPTEG